MSSTISSLSIVEVSSLNVNTKIKANKTQAAAVRVLFACIYRDSVGINEDFFRGCNHQGGLIMRVTIRDIARELGMSPSTVSQALNNKGKLRPETRGRVRATARLMGYFNPNDPFGPLPELSGRPMRVVTTAVTDNEPRLDQIQGFPLRVLRGIEDALEPYHIPMLLTSKRQLYNGLPKDHLGTLVIGGYIDDETAAVLEACQFPVVIIGSCTNSLRLCSVEADSMGGIRMAIEYLYGLGHRHIALLNGPDTTRTSERKYIGYLSAMNLLNLDHNYVFSTQHI